MTQHYHEPAQGLEEDSDGEYFDGGSDESEIDIDLDTPNEPAPKVDVPEARVDDISSFLSSWTLELRSSHKRSTPLSSCVPLQRLLDSPTLLECILRSPVLSMSDLKNSALVARPFLNPARRVIFGGILALKSPLQIYKAFDVLNNKPEIATLNRFAHISVADLWSVACEAEMVQVMLTSLRAAQDAEPPSWFCSKVSSKAIEGPQPWLEEVWKVTGRRASAKEVEATRKEQMRKNLFGATAKTILEAKEIVQEIEVLFHNFDFVQASASEFSYQGFPSDAVHAITSSTWFRNLRVLKLVSPAANFPGPFLAALGHELRILIISPSTKAYDSLPALGLKVVLPPPTLMLRPDGHGLAGRLSSVKTLELSNIAFVPYSPNDCLQALSETVDSPPWSLTVVIFKNISSFTEIDLDGFLSGRLTRLDLSASASVFTPTSIFAAIVAHACSLLEVRLDQMFSLPTSARTEEGRVQNFFQWTVGGDSDAFDAVPYVVRKTWALATGEPVTALHSKRPRQHATTLIHESGKSVPLQKGEYPAPTELKDLEDAKGALDGDDEPMTLEAPPVGPTLAYALSQCVVLRNLVLRDREPTPKAEPPNPRIPSEAGDQDDQQEPPTPEAEPSDEDNVQEPPLETRLVGSFGKEIIDALLVSRAPLSSVKVELRVGNFSTAEWKAFHQKVRQLMSGKEQNVDVLVEVVGLPEAPL